MDSIGKYIRQYRTERKMRQEDLAEKANISPNYIGMIERGEKILSLAECQTHHRKTHTCFSACRRSHRRQKVFHGKAAV